MKLETERVSISSRSEEWQAMANAFQRGVISMISDAGHITIFRDMSSIERVECMSAGVMTGLFLACLAALDGTKEGSDLMEEYITRCIPVARDSAEMIMREADKAIRKESRS